MARKRPEPVLGTHGNSGTRLLAAHLRSSRGQEGSDEQYGTTSGGKVSVACLLFSYLGMKSKTCAVICSSLEEDANALASLGSKETIVIVLFL